MPAIYVYVDILHTVYVNVSSLPLSLFFDVSARWKYIFWCRAPETRFHPLSIAFCLPHTSIHQSLFNRDSVPACFLLSHLPHAPSRVLSNTCPRGSLICGQGSSRCPVAIATSLALPPSLLPVHLHSGQFPFSLHRGGLVMPFVVRIALTCIPPLLPPVCLCRVIVPADCPFFPQPFSLCFTHHLIVPDGDGVPKSLQTMLLSLGVNMEG